MAEVLVEYTDLVLAAEGEEYVARACGTETDSGRWQGWIEFTNRRTGEILRSGRETTQPNRTDTLYWATGLSAVYLEGALDRALHPLVRASPRPTPPAAFDEPAPAVLTEPPPIDTVLNPFSVYRKGEVLLRSQLGALSAWHLVNIVRAHGLSDLSPGALNAMTPADLIDLIVGAVRVRMEASIPR